MPQSAETIRVCGGRAAITAHSSSFSSVGIECDARTGHRIDPERDFESGYQYDLSANSRRSRCSEILEGSARRGDCGQAQRALSENDR